MDASHLQSGNIDFLELIVRLVHFSFLVLVTRKIWSSGLEGVKVRAQFSSSKQAFHWIDAPETREQPALKGVLFILPVDPS